MADTLSCQFLNCCVGLKTFYRRIFYVIPIYIYIYMCVCVCVCLCVCVLEQKTKTKKGLKIFLQASVLVSTGEKQCKRIMF
jgi:hypothetical protein